MAEDAAATAAGVDDAGAAGAGAAVVDDTNSGAASSAAGSSPTGVLTAEERDNQTIARLFGTKPDGSPADDGAGAAAGDAADDAADPPGDADDADKATVPAEDGAEDNLEISDELVQAFIDAYGEEELLNNPRLRSRLEKAAQAEADRRFDERQAAQTVSEEQQLLVKQGRTAVTALFELGTKAAEELAKAERGEEFDAKAIDPAAIEKHMRSYGSAVVLEVKRGFDNAFTRAFTDGVSQAGPLSDEEKQAVIGIVQTANRIENDPKQGSDAAKSHLFVESVKFLVKRAREAGKAEAIADVTKRRDAIKKLVGEGGQNAVSAAIAKVAKAKKGLPTKPVAERPQPSSEGNVSVEAYKAAKRAGDFEKADQIAAAMSQQR